MKVILLNTYLYSYMYACMSEFIIVEQLKIGIPVFFTAV